MFIISFLWYNYESHILGNRLVDSYPDFILYILGYGDIRTDNSTIKTLFSLIGVFGISLLSSIFTVNLFELRNKANLSNKMLIWDNNNSQHLATVLLKSNSKDLYNIKVTLVYYCDSETFSEESYIPFLPKKSVKTLNFGIEVGSCVYYYLRSLIKNNASSPIMLITVSYTDITNAQEYNICKKYQFCNIEEKSNLVFFDNSLLKTDILSVSQKSFNAISKCNDNEYKKCIEEEINKDTFYLDMRKASPINAEDIDLEYGYSFPEPQKPRIAEEFAFTAKVHMNSKEQYQPNDICMACFTAPWDGNWEKYVNMNCNLTFEYGITGNISVVLEVKGHERKIVKKLELQSFIDVTNSLKKVSIPLKDFKEKQFDDISEMCFTVFYKNVNPSNPTGSFVIANCALEVSK